MIGDEDCRKLGRGRILLLSAACGAAAANIYYNQPMLGDIARALGARGGTIGFIPTATQVGFALGLLFLLPLGDRVERRRLIVAMAAVLSGVLLAASFAPTLLALVIASLLLGSVATIAQQIIAFGSQLVDSADLGKAVGSLMSGLLLGVLLARTLSGAVNAYLGWRAMFVLAAALMAAFTIALARLLPRRPPMTDLPYRALLGSLWPLIRSVPALREAAAIGAMLFGAFSVFWSTLALHLEARPFHLNSGAAGLFGLFGAAGALVAPIAGRAADGGHGGAVLWASCASVVSAFVIFAFTGNTLVGLGAGVTLLDLGVWAAQVANQQRIFASLPEARGRVNAVYMVCYFIGGAGGSALGSLAWSHGGWEAVSLVGAAMGCAALAVMARRLIAARRDAAVCTDVEGA